MEREYTLNEAVCNAVNNEADTFFEQHKHAHEGEAQVNAWHNRVYYAQNYGYSIEEFEAEFIRQYGKVE